MKKINTHIMKQALLFVAFVFSMNTYAQQLRPVTTGLLVTTSLENLQSKLEGAGIKGGIPGFNVAHDVNHSSRELLDLIQLLDSIYSYTWDTLSVGWALESKSVDFIYNAAGLPLSVTSLGWTGTDWENYAQINYTYDSHNNQTSVALDLWTGASWITFLKITSTYDGNNNLLTETEQFSNGISLMNSGRTTYTYDANNNLLTEISQSWNGAEWENVEYITRTYDASNNVVTKTTQVWDGSSWLNQTQDNNTYDGNNNLTYLLRKNWNGTAWVDALNATLSYDANNNVLIETDQVWNINAWENYGQYTYTYNANHDRTSELAKGWDGSNWVNYSVYAYVYDGENLVNERFQLWNGIAFVISENTIYTYDLDNFIESDSHREYDATGTIVTSGDSSFYYSHTASGIKDLSAGNGIMEVYPNPTSGKFTISSETTLRSVEVFNLLGERIYSNSKLNTQPTHEIDLSGYGKGIYIISTSDGVSNYSRKIIVQ